MRCIVCIFLQILAKSRELSAAIIPSTGVDNVHSIKISFPEQLSPVAFGDISIDACVSTGKIKKMYYLSRFRNHLHNSTSINVLLTFILQLYLKSFIS